MRSRSVIVVGIVAAWLAAAVHGGEPHVYCERHGTIEERGGEKGQAPGTIASSAASRHAACALVGDTPETAQVDAAPPAGELGSIPVALAGDLTVLGQIPILSAAPKTSPPQAS